MAGFLKTRTARPFFIDDVTAPFSDVAGASFGNTFTAGRELYGYLDRNLSRFVDKQQGVIHGTRLSREAIDSQVGDLPLEIPDDITQEHLDKLITSKNTEVRNQSILARAEQDILTGVGIFGAGLAASITDPLEVALSFIPVVGQTRKLKLLEEAGISALSRASARGKIGAIEGTVGASISEPFIYAGTQDRQADYTTYDSLTNIVFGGLLGGGLHIGAGGIKDKFFRPSPAVRSIDNLSEETRATALSTAMKQAGEGLAVNVDAVLKSDPRYIYTTGKIVSGVPDNISVKKGTLDLTPNQLSNKVLNDAVDDVLLTKRNTSSQPTLSKGEIKNIRNEVKNLKQDITKAKVDVSKESNVSIVNKATKRLKELEDTLSLNNKSIARNDISKADVKKINEIKENPENFDVKDYPPELRMAVDARLEGIHKTRSSQLLKDAINDNITETRKTSSLFTTPAEVTKVKNEVDEIGDKANDDLIDEAIDELRKNADTLQIKDEVSRVDDIISDLEKDADDVDNALNEWMTCRTING